MKKLFTIFVLLLCVFAHSQDPPKRPIRTDFIRIDTVTTAQRDLIAADAGKAQYVFNIDTNQLEERKPGGSWAAFSGSVGVFWCSSP